MPFILPLDLPQGAQVYSIDYYVIDNSDTSDIACMVGWYNPQTDAWSLGYGKTTSGASANIQTLTFAYTNNTPFMIVNNAANFYFLRIDLTDPYSQAITGARIGYALPSPPSGAQTLTLGGYAFQPDTSSMKYAPYGDRIYLTHNDQNHSLTARLNLPIGAQITGLTYYAIDNDPNSFMTLGILEAPVNGGAISPYETYTGDNPLLQPYSAPHPATVSAGSSYSLYVRFNTASNNLILAGARLTYTLPPDTPFRTTSSFAGMTFHPDNSAIGFSSSNGALFQTTPDSAMGFSAPLDLPQGSHITKATCYALDYDAAVSHVIECSLVAYQPGIAGRSDLYSANSSSPASSPSIRALKMIDPIQNRWVTVDNRYYQYRVWVSFDVATSAIVELFAVVVETGHQMFLPVVRR
jgi:hypothetical protein